MNSQESKAGHPPANKTSGVRHKEGKEHHAPLKKNDHQRQEALSDTSYDDEEVHLQRLKALHERELEAQVAAGQRAQQLEQNRTPIIPQTRQINDKIVQPRFANH
ncbi:hypothetical protein K7432_010534 [Basidiobolus ranarum]|uniref:Uncharacterized protein n=1 Tax=Basidiobolus ranarum TaxID=34480 RepID=A0ABR2WNL7_9FUNG